MEKDREFTEEEILRLCASGLFRGFGRSEVVSSLRQLNARRQVCRDGAVVAHESEAPTKMGVLLAGFLHVYDTAFRGTRHLVRIVRPGEVLGASLVGARQKTSAYSALVTAYGDVVLATFSLSEVDKCAKLGGGDL